MFITKHFITSAIHLGHKINEWNPKMAYYLFAISPTNNQKFLGKKAAIHIIDLEQTVIAMKRAFKFIQKICANRGYLLCIFGNSLNPIGQAKIQKTKVPQALFFLCPNTSIKEAIKLRIPVVAVCDSNTNLFGIEYPIPGNDDGIESHTLYTKWIQNAIVDGKKLEVQMFSVSHL